MAIRVASRKVIMVFLPFRWLTGQVCAAQTRALVHRDAIEEFLATALEVEIPA